jgi:nucleotide-binding universal stress UspA family protein
MTDAIEIHPPYRTIIATTDGSELSALGLRGGARLATQTGAALHVLHAVSSSGGETQVRALVKQVLREAEYQLVLEEVADPATPASTAANYAAGAGNAIICLGTHGRGGVGSAVLGSTALELVSQHRRSVIAFGPEAAPPMPIVRVVACVDGSEFSELSLGEGVRWAAALGVPLWLVQVVPSGLPDYVSAFEHTYVHNLAKSLAGSHLKLEWEVLHSSSPARALLEMFGEDAATLLVMATHGRRGVQKILLGSVATEVVKSSWGPVALIAPPASLT